jgi:hypothetical protein
MAKEMPSAGRSPETKIGQAYWPQPQIIGSRSSSRGDRPQNSDLELFSSAGH